MKKIILSLVKINQTTTVESRPLVRGALLSIFQRAAIAVEKVYAPSIPVKSSIDAILERQVASKSTETEALTKMIQAYIDNASNDSNFTVILLKGILSNPGSVMNFFDFIDTKKLTIFLRFHLDDITIDSETIINTLLSNGIIKYDESQRGYVIDILENKIAETLENIDLLKEQSELKRVLEILLSKIGKANTWQELILLQAKSLEIQAENKGIHGRGLSDVATILRAFATAPNLANEEKEILEALDSNNAYSAVIIDGSLASHEFIDALFNQKNIKAIVMVDFTRNASHILVLAKEKGKTVINITRDDADTILEILRNNTEQGLLIRQSEIKLLETKSKAMQTAKIEMARAETILTDARERADRPSHLLRDTEPIEVYTNKSSAMVAGEDRLFGNDGIGLARLETIFAYATNIAYQEFKRVFDSIIKASGGDLTIRVMEHTSDKPLKDISSDRESLRFLLHDTQGQAILASNIKNILQLSGNHKGKIKILFPNAVSFEEVEIIFSLIDQYKKELKDAGIAIDENIKVGFMVENPLFVTELHATLASNSGENKELLEKIDFFSVGSNDLLSYYLGLSSENFQEGGFLLKGEATRKGSSLLDNIQRDAKNQETAGDRIVRGIEILEKVADLLKKTAKDFSFCGDFELDHVPLLLAMGYTLSSTIEVWLIKHIIRLIDQRSMEKLLSDLKEEENIEKRKEMLADYIYRLLNPR